MTLREEFYKFNCPSCEDKNLCEEEICYSEWLEEYVIRLKKINQDLLDERE